MHAFYNTKSTQADTKYMKSANHQKFKLKMCHHHKKNRV